MFPLPSAAPPQNVVLPMQSSVFVVKGTSAPKIGS